MKTVKISELKNRLSHYLRRVRRGESILVADRDRIIARIDRVDSPVGIEGGDDEWLERLEQSGVIRRGEGRLSQEWLDAAPVVRADVVAALLRDREEGP